MMGKVMISGVAPQMKKPSTDILLSSIAEGSIVKLNEDGSPVEFYVACHNYESALNGTGRTLLVRKDCYDDRAWKSSNVNAWTGSDILSWLNNDYKSMLDTEVQQLISNTYYYYTPGNGNTGVYDTASGIFLLSLTELGCTDSRANTEGSALPIASILKIALLGIYQDSQWSRSPDITDTRYAMGLTSSGGPISGYCSNAYGSRPAFTLPYTAVFDKTTMLLKGVS